MWARENRSDIESELESEDPTEVGDDMFFSEEVENQEVIVTSAERRNPTAVSATSGQEVERRGDVPMPRKHAASVDVIGEREAKRTLSPRPSSVTLVSSPPAEDATGQAQRSEEWTCTHVSLGPVLACNSQPKDAPPAASVGVS